MSKKYDQAFLTGCDSKNEWMFKWFLENYKRHNNTPFIFADFGVSSEMLSWIQENVHCILDMTKVKEQGWFKKPRSMLYAPSKKTVWIDTDCQILENIECIFDKLAINKLSMVEGVEARVPYLDFDLVELAGHIPEPIKMKSGMPKYILKKVAEKYLPKEVVYRSKTGFGAPVNELIKKEFKKNYRN